jgi:PAS domain-containing protein
MLPDTQVLTGVFRAMGEGVLALNYRQRVVVMNPAAERLLEG